MIRSIMKGYLGCSLVLRAKAIRKGRRLAPVPTVFGDKHDHEGTPVRGVNGLDMSRGHTIVEKAAGRELVAKENEQTEFSGMNFGNVPLDEILANVGKWATKDQGATPNRQIPVSQKVGISAPHTDNMQSETGVGSMSTSTQEQSSSKIKDYAHSMYRPPSEQDRMSVCSKRESLTAMSEESRVFTNGVAPSVYGDGLDLTQIRAESESLTINEPTQHSSHVSITSSLLAEKEKLEKLENNRDAQAQVVQKKEDMIARAEELRNARRSYADKWVRLDTLDRELQRLTSERAKILKNSGSLTEDAVQKIIKYGSDDLKFATVEKFETRCNSLRSDVASLKIEVANLDDKIKRLSSARTGRRRLRSIRDRLVAAEAAFGGAN